MDQLLGCQLATTIVRIPIAPHPVENRGSFTTGGKTHLPTTQNSTCKKDKSFPEFAFFPGNAGFSPVLEELREAPELGETNAVRS